MHLLVSMFELIDKSLILTSNMDILYINDDRGVNIFDFSPFDIFSCPTHGALYAFYRIQKSRSVVEIWMSKVGRILEF